MQKKLRVLFFCKHNSCRSQIAEAILRSLSPDRFEVHSAGLYPQPIHPLVYTVMEEIGMNLHGHASKSVDLYLGKHPFDYIIIVCQESEADCPRLYPFALHIEHWPMNDPAAITENPDAMQKAFQNTRDTLLMKIRQWVDSLETQIE